MTNLATFILGIIISAIAVLLLYRKAFELNARRAIAKKKTLIFPDLDDLITTFLAITILVSSLYYLNYSLYQYNSEIVKCKDNDPVEINVPKGYDYCYNQFNNIVFINGIETRTQIEKDYSELITELNAIVPNYSNDYFDNLRYHLYSNAKTLEEKQLYNLLTIENNYYFTNETLTEWKE